MSLPSAADSAAVGPSGRSFVHTAARVAIGLLLTLIQTAGT